MIIMQNLSRNWGAIYKFTGGYFDLTESFYKRNHKYFCIIEKIAELIFQYINLIDNKS